VPREPFHERPVADSQEHQLQTDCPGLTHPAGVLSVQNVETLDPAGAGLGWRGAEQLSWAWSQSLGIGLWGGSSVCMPVRRMKNLGANFSPNSQLALSQPLTAAGELVVGLRPRCACCRWSSLPERVKPPRPRRFAASCCAREQRVSIAPKCWPCGGTGWCPASDPRPATLSNQSR